MGRAFVEDPPHGGPPYGAAFCADLSPADYGPLSMLALSHFLTFSLAVPGRAPWRSLSHSVAWSPIVLSTACKASIYDGFLGSRSCALRAFS